VGLKRASRPRYGAGRTSCGAGDAVALSGGVGRVMWGGAAVRSDGTAVGHDFAIVIKDNDSIAQEAPALLGEGGDDPSSVVIALVSVGTRWLVRAHLDLRGDCIFRFGWDAGVSNMIAVS
jgi:hypothetical protein